MNSLFPLLDFREKYKIDFTLVPAAVILLEFAVLGTEISKTAHHSVKDILLMRIIHTLAMLLLAFGLSRIYISLNKTYLSYFGITIPGFIAILLGILLHRILANALNVETLSIYRNVATGLLQAFFWFPLFIWIGSKRTEIFTAFREYEQRLITKTRANSRTSEDFRHVQTSIQDKVRLELFNYCKKLRNEISAVDLKSLTLPESNSQMQKYLLGEDLRGLSMRLETFGSEQEESTFLGQNTQSVKLLVSQFRVLYSTIFRIAPLKTQTYAFVLIILITPAYINYFSLSETLVSFPLVSIAIFIFSRLITKASASHSPIARRSTSLLIYATGLLPLVSNQIGQAITHDPRTAYPIYIGAFTLPASYYIFMKFIQVLQPHAVELIINDEITASSELRNAVTHVIEKEFSHTISHRWAIYIHGKILTRLAATSLKLESATNANDEKVFSETVLALLELLNSPDANFEQSPNDLNTEIHSRLDPWFGLLDINLEIDEQLASMRNSRVQDLGEVIEELVSNSIRHGKAQKISLRVSRRGENDIRIHAIDDATIPPPNFQGRFGLGTRIFNLASDGRWDLTRVGSTTEFNLVMTMES